MKYLDEYRDGEKVRLLVDKIKSFDTKSVSIMEVCGSQTHTIMKYGLEELLPDNINIIHGPGCPVCVTPVEMIDYAMNIAREKDVVMTTYGDMMRVPGSSGNMLSLKAEGADIRIIYSPLDAVNIAGRESGKKVVLFAIGFETTAPANAAAIIYSRKIRLDNFLCFLLRYLSRRQSNTYYLLIVLNLMHCWHLDMYVRLQASNGVRMFHLNIICLL
jgi:hydrogenase expression/formation protein HypD